MKYSLLDMTQEILTSMTSDQVNSITDTTESMAVATIIRRVYYNIVSRANLPEHFDLFQLTASGTTALPTIMYRPDTIHKISWIKYNTATTQNPEPRYRDVCWLPLDEMMCRLTQLSTLDTTVFSSTITIGSDTITFLGQKNISPRYWSSFNDTTLIFDAYDNTMDATLQQSKTMCWGEKSTAFQMVDAFVPDLDEQQFSLLLNEAASTCWAELKQAANAKTEREANRQWMALQKNKDALRPSTAPEMPALQGRR